MDTDKIVHLLHEKTRLFMDFLEISKQMCTADIDLLEQEMQKRLDLQKQIEALDSQLQPLFQANPDAAEAAKNKCDVGRLTAENAKVYDAALKLHGILFQLQKIEPQLRDRLLTERSALLEKLESTQKSPAAAAHRYYQSAHMTYPVARRSPHFGDA